MIIYGKYNMAKVFTEDLEKTAATQIRALTDRAFTKDSVIRIMPDAHAGAGCTIGTTMTIKDTVVPNLVGVDIGCGMLVNRLKETRVDFAKLDRVVIRNIPSGFSIRNKPHPYLEQIDLSKLRCLAHIDRKRAEHSIGSLGGGNHFIEINQDKDGRCYLVVHTGSRHLGKQIADHYQKSAQQQNQPEGRDKKKRQRDPLAHLSGQAFEDYIHDMHIAQRYASVNREAIAYVIVQKMGFAVDDAFVTVHNYIDMKEMILRKGAISAKANQRVIIPINMRDGSILAVGKGIRDWNESAPHGAGRIMSRRKAKETLSMQAFKKQMKGIHSSTVTPNTLDEAPSAYKPMNQILEAIKPTVDVIDIIRPLYNFKATGD